MPRMKHYLEPISDLALFILVALADLKLWPQIGWKGLNTERFDPFLGLNIGTLINQVLKAKMDELWD